MAVAVLVGFGVVVGVGVSVGLGVTVIEGVAVTVGDAVSLERVVGFGLSGGEIVGFSAMTAVCVGSAQAARMEPNDAR